MSTNAIDESDFETFDSNHDGVLSNKEFTTGITQKRSLFKKATTKVTPLYDTIKSEVEGITDTIKSEVEGITESAELRKGLDSIIEQFGFRHAAERKEASNKEHLKKNPHLSCRGRCVGMIRIFLVFFFVLSFLLTLAVAIAVVILINFVVAKSTVHSESKNHPEYHSLAIAWTLATPWLMLIFALLMEQCIKSILDTLQNSRFNQSVYKPFITQLAYIETRTNFFFI